ncbi:MAG: hypothetical protein ACYCW6_02070 [Candidatus Xenobia bacterium]
MAPRAADPGGLKQANGVPTGASLTVVNAPGSWGIKTGDAMFESYIYPLEGQIIGQGAGANLTMTIASLPAGTYDFYFYSFDSSFRLRAGNVFTPTKTACCVSDSGVLDKSVTPPHWTEGRSYVVFRQIAVSGPVEVTVQHGKVNPAVICGMQIVKR